VIARFFIHSTLGQNGLEAGTSVKPAQFCAAASGAARAPAAKAAAASA
jgi:hypothetical protein